MPALRLMNRYRTDRLLTLYCFHPILRTFGARGLPRIPILMYHSVSRRSAEQGHPYFALNTDPAVFDLHLSSLRDLGYRVVGLDEIVDRVSGSRSDGAKGDDRCAVVTFDDGFRDVYDIAYPMLDKYGFRATVFLPTKYVGNRGTAFQGRECMTWDEVRFLSGKGIEFGSHTVSHDLLVEMSADRIEQELKQSKSDIEHETGTEARFFSYPFRYPENDRAFVRRLEELLERTGYRAAVSTRIGTARRGDRLYSLKRIPVNSNDDPRLFQAKLEGGYDWLYPLQYVKKRLIIY